MGCVRLDAALFLQLYVASFDCLLASVTAVFSFTLAGPHGCKKKKVVLPGFPAGVSVRGVTPSPQDI